MSEKQYFYGEVNYTSLVKARNFLADIIQNAKNDYEKTGTIKAFEFCYELAWRVMKKVLTFHGIDTDNVRDAFRETAKLKLITSSEVWFAYLDKRNITVHTYRKEILDSLFFSITQEFLKDLDYFLARLEKEAPKYATNGN